MPFNAVKNLHQSDIGGLVTLNYFYAVTRELSGQTTVPTITHIPHNSGQSITLLGISFSMPGSSKTDGNTILVRHGSCSVSSKLQRVEMMKCFSSGGGL